MLFSEAGVTVAVGNATNILAKALKISSGVHVKLSCEVLHSEETSPLSCSPSAGQTLSCTIMRL